MTFALNVCLDNNVKPGGTNTVDQWTPLNADSVADSFDKVE